jgi:hypothetical protein
MSFGANPSVVNGRSQSALDLCASPSLQHILTTIKHTEHPTVVVEPTPAVEEPEAAATVPSDEEVRLHAMAELSTELVVRGLAVTGVDSTLKVCLLYHNSMRIPCLD